MFNSYTVIQEYIQKILIIIIFEIKFKITRLIAEFNVFYYQFLNRYNEMPLKNNHFYVFINYEK